MPMDPHETTLRARAEAQIGTTLVGKYRLDRVLGIGGMATVFAATHRNQAELAVKLLHQELNLREDLKKRFLREGYVANSVKHPGAVMVVDDDIAADGSAFLVMELLRGATLEAVWEESGRRLPSRIVTAITLQLLDVLTAAHEKAIVHRDLKPANLFVTIDGSLKVLDFGIARLRDAVGTDNATRTGTLMGTPAFMAPEQAQAVADEIDGQTDLWAVGATMFTLLTGQLVHAGSNNPQLLIQAGTARARPIASVLPDIEAPIAAVVDRALAFDKSARWQSARVMREALLSAVTECFGTPRSRDTLVELLPDVPRMSLRFTAETQPPGSSQVPQPPARPPGTTSGVRPPLEGTTTGSPVSAGAGALVSPRPQMMGKIVTGGAVAVAIGAVAFALHHPGPAPTRGAPLGSTVNAESPPPASAALPSTAPPTNAPAPPIPPPTPMATPITSEVSASAIRVPVQMPPKPRAALPPAASAPRVSHDCSVAPYWYDGKGDKHWYPECQQ
jgi:serine/threonine protein kinase